MNEKRPPGGAKESADVQPWAQPIPMGYFVPISQPEDQDQINLLDWLLVLIKHKKLIIAAAFVCAFAAAVISLFMTPIYRAEVLLVPVQGGQESGGLRALAGQFGGLADLAGLSMPGGEGVDISLVTLQSRRFIDHFVREQKIKPILFEERWNKETVAWTEESPSVLAMLKSMVVSGSGAKPANDLAPGEPSLLETYKLFTEQVLAVNKNDETGVVTVQIDWKDPVVAAEWANALVARLNAEIRQAAIDESERSIGYLKEQIDNTNLAGLQTVLYRLIEEHTKNITLAKANEDYALKIVDPAVIPDESVRPNRRVMVALGFMAGLLLGMLAAFRKDLLDRAKAG
jgi:uncharacterized protein involved in exopolysaccharide biosynthesis